MPQIGQRDYLYIKPVNADTVVNDAAALGQLKKAMESGTAWDCLIANYGYYEEGLVNLSRVLCVYGEPVVGSLFLFDADAGRIVECVFSNTTTQYEGLAAIQAELKAGGSIITKLPVLANSEGGLMEVYDGTYVSVDGCYLIPTIDSARIVSLSIGDKIPDGTDFINITWEDAQKLIGLPIQ